LPGEVEHGLDRVRRGGLRDLGRGEAAVAGDRLHGGGRGTLTFRSRRDLQDDPPPWRCRTRYTRPTEDVQRGRWRTPRPERHRDRARGATTTVRHPEQQTRYRPTGPVGDDSTTSRGRCRSAPGNPGLFHVSPRTAASTPTLNPGGGGGPAGARRAATQALAGRVQDHRLGRFSRHGPWPTAQDWSGYDGFSFWVKGTGLRPEDRGSRSRWAAPDGRARRGCGSPFFTDDGQRLEEGPGRLREPEEAGRLPALRRAEQRADLTDQHVGLRGQTCRATRRTRWEFDDVQVYQSLQTLQGLRGPPTRSPTPAARWRTPASFSWGGNADSTPTLSIAPGSTGPA